MINAIKDGVTNAIYNAFGNEYKIYTESIKQGFDEPCFYIQMLETVETPYIGNRSRLTVPVVVQYFTDSSSRNREFADVAIQLQVVLHRIEFNGGDMVNGLNIRSVISDEVLTVIVEYQPIIIYSSDDDSEQMETISSITEVGE